MIRIMIGTGWEQSPPTMLKHSSAFSEVDGFLLLSLGKWWDSIGRHSQTVYKTHDTTHGHLWCNGILSIWGV